MPPFADHRPSSRQAVHPPGWLRRSLQAPQDCHFLGPAGQDGRHNAVPQGERQRRQARGRPGLAGQGSKLQHGFLHGCEIRHADSIHCARQVAHDRHYALGRGMRQFCAGSLTFRAFVRQAVMSRTAWLSKRKPSGVPVPQSRTAQKHRIAFNSCLSSRRGVKEQTKKVKQPTDRFPSCIREEALASPNGVIEP